VGFLVYDSRSGSTLLAREMTARLDGVFVTPEIGFDGLLAMRESELIRLGWPAVLGRLYDGYEFRHFDLPFEVAASLLHDASGTPLGRAQAVRVLLAAYVARLADPGTRCVIVKNGSHLRHWRALQALFGGALRLIHITRDPRAVINSKLRTQRPYRPAESMAWGGPLLAAVRWRRYVEQAQRARRGGVAIHTLRYEDLLATPDSVIDGIARFLGAPVRAAASGSAYGVPERERSIHRRIAAPGFDSARETAWQRELSGPDRFQIETLCASAMSGLGYRAQAAPGPLNVATAWCRGLPRAIVGTLRHALIESRPLR
jgi:hypothetical protein